MTALIMDCPTQDDVGAAAVIHRLMLVPGEGLALSVNTLSNSDGIS